MKGKLVGAFLRSPLLRTVIYGLIVAVVVLGTLIVTRLSRTLPVIHSVDPMVVSPGDLLTITGKDFGKERGNSAVLIGDSRITASHYLSWTNTHIVFTLPPNSADGLIVVETPAGVSKPQIVTNADNIPVVLPGGTRDEMPIITSLSRENAFPGALLIIRGANFGAATKESAVLFTSAYGEIGHIDQLGQGLTDITLIEASQKTGDIDSWTDTEIRVFVPEAAASGNLFVRNRWGESVLQPLNIDSPGGKRTFTNSRVYVVSFDTDITEVTSTEEASLLLRVPRPAVSALQPRVILESCKPPPINPDYDGMLIHQIPLNNLTRDKSVFEYTFLVTVMGVEMNFSDTPPPYSAATRSRFKSALDSEEPFLTDAAPDRDAAAVTALARQIVGRETNPVTQARLLFDYLTTGDGNSVSRAPYTAALTFCRLSRSLGIPTLPVAGIVADSIRQAKNHWWAEFYVEQFGWVPVDLAERTFAALNSAHVAFSRGWRTVKSAFPDSHIVYRPRTFAFQSIWEESSLGTDSYSSFWSDPVVTGVY